MATYVFTGRGVVGKRHIPREECHRLTMDAGHRYADAVMFGVDYLVTADPTSLSIKARSARAIGVQLISYALWLEQMSRDATANYAASLQRDLARHRAMPVQQVAAPSTPPEPPVPDSDHRPRRPIRL